MNPKRAALAALAALIALCAACTPRPTGGPAPEVQPTGRATKVRLGPRSSDTPAEGEGKEKTKDAIFLEPSDFAPASTQLLEGLPLQRWSLEGGGREVVAPPEGKTFLVVDLNGTAGRDKLVSNFEWFDLHLEGVEAPLKPHAVTNDPANWDNPTPRHYQAHAKVTHYTPRPDAPFALVFIVPREAHAGTLQIKDLRIPLTW